MNSIKAIVFDLGNVLIPFDYNVMINRLNIIRKNLGDEYYELYKKNYHVHRQFEKGELASEEFIRINLEWLDNKITSDKFCYLYSDIFKLNEATISLLPALKAKYRLFLLSNTNVIHKKYGYEHYKFLKLFDRLFLSHEEGAVKPEEKIYRTVEKFSGFKSTEHLFVDDIAEYIEGAKNIGWQAIQFFSAEQLTAELKAYNIL